MDDAGGPALILIPAPVRASVEALGRALRARGQHLALAESCTGGLLAGACTAVAGASDWFRAGFVTYANEAKQALLGVPPALLAAHGAVSAEVAAAMARGALQRADADWALAVTGIAGPGGGSPAKPVGTVWLGLAWRAPADAVGPGAGRGCTERLQLPGDRDAVRTQTVQRALDSLLARVGATPVGPGP